MRRNNDKLYHQIIKVAEFCYRSILQRNIYNNESFHKVYAFNFILWELRSEIIEIYYHEMNSALPMLFLLFLYWTNISFRNFIYTSTLITF